MVWASERLIARPSARGIAILGALTAYSAFGGHIQTTLHVGLWVFAYAAWRISGLRPLVWRVQRKALASWVAGIVLGVGLSAVSLVPLACYLTRSPVWADREIDHGSPWVIDPPRLRESICTAIPYAYGSQRRGHPNVARALGIENLNESAGGFAGLATIACLAPLGLIRGSPRGHVRFLGVMTALGFLGAFQIPPIVNVLRATPVLDVVDERRLSLWVAIGLIYLAARGLDAATVGARLAGMWNRFWAIGGALALTCAIGIVVGAPWIRSHALADGHDPSEQVKVGRHVERLIHALPVIYSIAGIQLVCLAGVAALERRSRLAPVVVPTSLAALALADLVGFGFGINPAIPRESDRPDSAVIARLRQVASPPARVLAIGEDLPPNLLMRYGLSDIRNYDSIELARSLDAFDLLYEPDPKRQARTSRRTITWDGVKRSLPLLREAGVTVVVSASQPPERMFQRVEMIGSMFLCHTGATPPRITRETPGQIRIDLGPNSGDVAWVPETFDPGWTALADGKLCRVQTHQGPFLSVSLPLGSRSILLVYDPVEVRLGMGVSVVACVLALSLVSYDVHRGKNARKPCGKRNDRKRIDSTIAATQPASIATAGFDAHGPLFV
jgi:hypothetical protein